MALNGEKSPSISLWILMIISGFTYLLGRNLEFEKGLGVPRIAGSGSQ